MTSQGLQKCPGSKAHGDTFVSLWRQEKTRAKSCGASRKSEFSQGLVKVRSTDSPMSYHKDKKKDKRAGRKCIMLDKEKVRIFFDSYAPKWDQEMIIDDHVVNCILDNARVEEGKNILDVACGSGVLTPYYLARKVKSVTGIDFSAEMIKIADGKTISGKGKVRYICADAEDFMSDMKFDSIVIYNAFPHFRDPEKIIKNLSRLLAHDGVITVAHGMSREKINMHHKNVPEVSNELMSAEELEKIFKKYVNVTVCISDESMYQLAGAAKKVPAAD